MTLPNMNEIEVVSTIDGSPEKSLLHAPESAAGGVLLVGLHSWSADRFNQVERMLPCCVERGWALLLPEFRGPNLTRNPRAPAACASKLARQDIIDALDAVLDARDLDPSRVLLLGGSGGGHMSLMMAGYAPERWKAVSSWCPITDVGLWHGQNPNYAPHVVACCGGVPGQSEDVDRECRERSPMTCAADVARANVFVHHGRYDRSVPYTQTLDFALEVEKHAPERFFFEIFDGAHELRYPDAFMWFDDVLGAEEGVEITG